VKGRTKDIAAALNLGIRGGRLVKKPGSGNEKLYSVAEKIVLEKGEVE
jgi:hypothetical protein